MESSLFNPGFLGGTFYWFIGQVADDSTWRENQNPEKFDTTEDKKARSECDYHKNKTFICCSKFLY